jgi:hypothetical protein
MTDVSFSYFIVPDPAQNCVRICPIKKRQESWLMNLGLSQQSSSIEQEGLRLIIPIVVLIVS